MSDFRLAPYLREWLDNEGITAAELGRRSNLTPQHMSKLVNGTNKGDWETLTKLARGMGMTRAQLVAAVDGQPPPPNDDGIAVLAAVRHDPNLSAADADQLIVLYQHFRRPRP